MISVIIPVFNVEKYLDSCLESVLSNTYRDIEVICVNDGSTDGSLDILRKWKAKDSRIIIVSHENRGLPEARNSGLAVARGDYTAFIDSDDLVHPQYFQSLLDCMEKTDADMVVSEVWEFQDDQKVPDEPVPDLQFRKLTKKEFFDMKYPRRTVWGRLLRKRDTCGLRFPPEVDAHQDTLYNLKLIANLKKPNVYMIDTPMYYYRQRPGSLFKKRSYGEMMEIAEWYVSNERDPFHQKNGEWGCLLLCHSVSAILSCRYQAKLQGNKDLVRRTNALLRILVTDVIRDKSIRLMYKITRSMAILSPHLYSWFREYNGTAIHDGRYYAG